MRAEEFHEMDFGAGGGEGAGGAGGGSADLDEGFWVGERFTTVVSSELGSGGNLIGCCG